MVIVALMSIGTTDDPKFYIGCLLAIVMGFTLRIAIEWNNNALSWKKSFIQALMSLVLCYVSVIVWRDITPNVKLEYYLFFCSLFSVFIVGLLEKVFKLGLSGYARILLRRVLAEDAHPNSVITTKDEDA